MQGYRERTKTKTARINQNRQHEHERREGRSAIKQTESVQPYPGDQKGIVAGRLVASIVNTPLLAKPDDGGTDEARKVCVGGRRQDCRATKDTSEPRTMRVEAGHRERPGIAQRAVRERDVETYQEDIEEKLKMMRERGAADDLYVELSSPCGEVTFNSKTAKENDSQRLVPDPYGRGIVPAQGEKPSNFDGEVYVIEALRGRISWEVQEERLRRESELKQYEGGPPTVTASWGKKDEEAVPIRLAGNAAERRETHEKKRKTLSNKPYAFDVRIFGKSGPCNHCQQRLQTFLADAQQEFAKQDKYGMMTNNISVSVSYYYTGDHPVRQAGGPGGTVTGRPYGSANAKPVRSKAVKNAVITTAKKGGYWVWRA